MKTKHLIIQLSFIVSATLAQVVPNKDFVTHLPPVPGTKENLDNVPSAIDLTNNAVYISGYFKNSTTLRDYVLIKYDLNGNVVWQRTFDYSSKNDRALAITVDNAGNIYLTGEATSALNGSDIVTRKYDTNGNLLWSVAKNGSANADDKGLGITVDNSGDVYVCGYVSNTGTGKDFAVIRYNSSGVEQYTYAKNGTANGDDAANAIVSFGNRLYITGSVNNAGKGADIYITRLSSNNANVNWSVTENGDINMDDQGLDIKVQGNDVLVCGGIFNSFTKQDYFFAKYNATNGGTNFVKQYDAFNGDDFATSLVLDASNTYAIVGLAQKGTNYEYHTAKYNNAGTLSWVNKHPINTNFLNVYPKIAVDNLVNHFYVSGVKFNTSLDAGIYQITPGGNESWADYHDGLAGLRDGNVDLSVDNLGRIYLASQVEVSPNAFEIALIRYSQTPVYFPPDLGTPELKDKNFVFKKNMGQLKYVNNTTVPENEISYYYQGKSPSVYINNNRISYLLIRSKSDTLPADSSSRLDVNFDGANKLTRVFSYDMTSSYSNYFIDSESFPNVKSYERLFIPNAYSMVDVHHTSNTAGLKTYFAFKNNEAISTVTLGIDGSNGTYVNLNGELIAQTYLGPVNIGKLNAYQINASLAAVPISGTVTWVSLGSNKYGFSVSSFNPVLPLIITLSRQGATSAASVSNIDNLYWSTYIGDVGNEDIHQSEIDAKNQLYTTGYTYSSSFPVTVGAYQGTGSNPNNRQYAIFSKFNSLGRQIYSSYYGSSGFYNPCGGTVAVEAMDITVDSLYSIYIVGKTNSTTLPVQGPFGSMTYANAGAGCQNAFIAKFDSTGSSLKWASYFGGTGYDMFSFVKYGFGSIICGGNSTSPSIPLVFTFANSYQTSSGRGSFLHLDTSGLLIHSTKLKGEPKRGDFDKNGNAYVVGTVQNLDPTSPVQTSMPGAYQQGWAGGANDWFIHKFNPSDSLTWATNVGGGGYDICTSLCIRDTLLGICGYGFSYNFPFLVAGSDSGDVAPKTFTSSPSFTSDEIQMAKFNIKTGKRIWVAYHATVLAEQANDLRFDSDYNMYITGLCFCPTGSPISCVSGNPFRTLQAPGYYYQSTRIGTEGFVLAFDKNNRRKWLTFFGASIATVYNQDIGKTMSINSKNQLFSCGSSYLGSSSLPLSRWNSTCYYDSTSADISPNQNADGYITMFDVSNFTAIGIVEHSIPVRSNSFVLFPNPNSGAFTIRLNENINEPVDIEVFNVLGQSVYEKKIRDKQEISLELTSLKQGVYFVNLGNKTFNETVKFIVE